MPGFVYTPIPLADAPEELRQVDAAWQRARGDAFAPTRRAMDLLTLPAPLVPFTSITDYDAAREAFTIRFFGSGLADIDGLDLTGRPLEDTPHDGLRDALFRLFEDVVVNHTPNFATFQFVTLGGARSMSVTGRWPLSEDGETVTGILSVIAPEQHVYDLNRLLGLGRERRKADPAPEALHFG